MAVSFGWESGVPVQDHRDSVIVSND